MMKPFVAGLAALLACASFAVAQNLQETDLIPQPESRMRPQLDNESRGVEQAQVTTPSDPQPSAMPGQEVVNGPYVPPAQNPQMYNPSTPIVLDAPQGPIVHSYGDSTVVDAMPGEDTCKSCIWGSVDYLLWWVKESPVGAPLITTNKNSEAIGAIGEAGTVVLAGGAQHALDYGVFSGFRATVGSWIDSQKTCGVEFSYFMLGTNTTNFSAASAGGTAPIVSIPFFATVAFPPLNLNPAGETALNAGGDPNTVTLSSSSRLWGTEASGVFRLSDGPNGCLILLAGVRYLQLNEGLALNDTIADPTTGGIVSVTDSFATNNEFWGGQLGLRAEFCYNRLTVQTTLKCAVGVNYAAVDINGDSVVTKGAAGFTTGTYPGGVFAQASNIGRHATTAFSAVPEAQCQVAYDLSKHLRAVFGYSFLDVTDVVRPGQQIDRNINPTQNVLFGGTGGVLQGAAAPLGTINWSNYWAQGLNFGFQFRF
jgi:Putative beta barrel porin-7 (BBP7)